MKLFNRAQSKFIKQHWMFKLVFFFLIDGEEQKQDTLSLMLCVCVSVHAQFRGCDYFC